MKPVTIHCKGNDWGNILKANLRRDDEVDLVSFNGDDNADDCRELARKHSMIFEWPDGKDYPFFRKDMGRDSKARATITKLSA